jgi:ketosteroid isomerase-like protein
MKTRGGNVEKSIVSSKATKNIEVMLKLFGAIERRDEETLLSLYQPDVEFHWPTSLPYGGTSRGLAVDRPSWEETWIVLQPTEAERRFDPRIVAASDDEVVILYHQRGMSPSGETLDAEVLGVYQLCEEKLARAQMFYFDPVAVTNFIARAITPEQQQRLRLMFHRLMSLPPDDRLRIRQAYKQLQTAPPDKREQLLRSEKFRTVAGLFGDDQDLLGQLLMLDPSHLSQGSCCERAPTSS